MTDQSDEWEILNLPAIAEADEDILMSATDVHHRKAGEAQCASRFPCSRTLSAKSALTRSRRSISKCRLRLLRGESVELLSRELGVPIYKLEQWREKADAPWTAR